jgi:hypothetical protein
MRNPDRRESRRTVADKILCIQLEPDNSAIVLNISDGGLAFHAFQPVLGTGAIQFSFSQPNHQRVQVTANLVWQDGTKKTGGLCFASLPAATREQIRNWALQAAPAAPSEASPAMPMAYDLVPVLDHGGPAPSASVSSQRFPDSVSLSQPEIPRPLLLDNLQARYRSDPLALADPRPKFFRGFATGAIVSALAMAVAFFAYGPQINDALAQLRGSTGTQATPEKVQLALAQPITPSPVVSPTPVDPAPTASPSSPETASDTQATPAASTASAILPDVAGTSPADLRRADSDLRRAAEPAGPVSSDSATLGKRTPRAEGDTGEKELALAQGYLRNSGSAASAVALLWSAVGKGNVAAEVKLAELYARGDGVKRSCDQARVLLYAAASKGSDEADQQLAQIARARCN